KFDPIAQEDYYSFTAFFQNIHLYGKVADVVGGGQPVDKEGIFRKLPSGDGETLCVREHEEAPPKTFVFVRGNAHTPGKEVLTRYIEVLAHSDKQGTGGNGGNRGNQTEGSKEDGELSPSPPSVPSVSSQFPPLPPVSFDPKNSRGRRLALAKWIAT